eukprot:CFRG8243T1
MSNFLGQDPYEKRRGPYGYKEPLTDAEKRAEKDRIKNKTREEYDPKLDRDSGDWHGSAQDLEGHTLKVWQDIQWRKDHDEYAEYTKSSAGSIFSDIASSAAIGAMTGGPFGAVMGVVEGFCTLIIGGMISAFTDPKHGQNDYLVCRLKT